MWLSAAAVALCCFLPAQANAESIRDALAAAYKYNPRLDAERARLRATDEEVARANSGYRPTITGNAEVNHIDQSTRGPIFNQGKQVGIATNRETFDPRGYSVNLVQPIFSGFRTQSQVEEAEATVRAGRETLKGVEQSVLLEAVTAYMDVVRDQAILKLRENNVTVLSRELKAAQDRFSVGEVTRTDVAQAQARRAGAVSALDLARANLKTSRANFERTVGHPPSNLVDQQPHAKLVPKSLNEAIAVATRENPNVIAALYREQSSRYTVDRIRGELLPEVRLEAEYERFKDPSPGTYDREAGRVTGRLTVPLYTNGEVEARVRQAKQNHVANLQVIEQARSESQQFVVAAWAQLEAAKAQLISDNSQVEANRTALNGVREEERVGQRTLLDVLNAEQELLNAEVNLVGTKRNVVVASYNLLSAIGKLTVVDMGVTKVAYDPEAHYLEVRRQWRGIDITHSDGRREHVDVLRDHDRQRSVKDSGK